MSSHSNLWLPPLPPKGQQRLDRQRKRQQRNFLSWTGFQGKTLWDFLQLLAALQSYLDHLSEFLLNNHLDQALPCDEVTSVAQARTLTILPQLNGTRKREVISFLFQAQLLQNGRGPDISLIGADLPGADLSGADLTGTDLSRVNLNGARLYMTRLDGANLRKADLSNADLGLADLENADLEYALLYKADLTGAHLDHTNLSHAVLNGASLNRADLSFANLSSASVVDGQLAQAKSLSSATMPDQSTHP